jgi:hypothetical protein
MVSATVSDAGLGVPPGKWLGDSLRRHFRSEQTLMRLNDITVGHPGDVVTDRAMEASLLDAFPGLSADFIRMLEVQVE